MYYSNQSPVQPVPFGQGMQISLNNFYDILKAQAGGLGVNEFLQLKLVANGVDITDKKNTDNGYEWWSYYNLLNRSDLAITPVPVDGSVLTGATKLSLVFGKFLNKLASFVLLKELSQDDQNKKLGFEADMDSLKRQIKTLSDSDYIGWKQYCELRGINPGDIFIYNQWAESEGNGAKIKDLFDEVQQKHFEIIKIINKRYSDPGDQDIVDALVNYNRSTMKLCYPIFPDYEYLPQTITLQYLAGLLDMSNSQFESRYVCTFDKTLGFLKTAVQGSLNAVFNRTTSESSSITTDWSSSGSIGYFFINVNANASEHKKITEEFKTATNIALNSKATIRLNINYGPWFRPDLFTSKYIKENPQMFHEFFGANGSLLYYPTALILIRGFGIEFANSQAWAYDYEESFRASVGGGFNIFGINFGGSTSYSQNIAEHKIDQVGTSLKIYDDDSTLRFVGYVVTKNDFLEQSILVNYNENGFSHDKE